MFPLVRAEVQNSKETESKTDLNQKGRKNISGKEYDDMGLGRNKRKINGDGRR